MGAARGRGRNGACLKAFSLLIGVTAVTAWESARARADLIELRGGGQVQGKAVADPKNKDRVQVWLLRGRNPLSFQKGQVVKVIPQPSPLDDYVLKRAKAPATAAAQCELGSWCDENKLKDLARVHYETALTLDANFDQAHRKLGHLYQEGTWLTRDDVNAAQGLVKYKGRWITAEEKTKRENVEQTTAAQVSWLRRIKVLRQAILNGPNDRRREAEAQLMAIRDTDAVTPLVRVFGQDDPPRRILLAFILSSIGGPEATKALVRRVLDEPDSEVRSVTLDHLKQRDEAGVPAQFARALASENVVVINRAAWALQNLETVEAVPRLVSVLITTEDQIVMVPPGVQYNGPPLEMSAEGLVPRAVTNSGVVFTTPPQVSNNAVAYGMMAVPYYAMGSASIGNSPMSVGAPLKGGPEPKVVTFTYRNVEVLAALQKLTGQDFGYDLDSWRRWIARSFNPNPKPARRVPQP
jgi:hypothetical protein